MSSYHKTGKRDANEPQITAVLVAANVRYTYLKPGDGADLIVWTSPMLLVEVKNPAQPPSARKLTEAEERAQEYAKDRGIPYHVVCEPEEMARILAYWTLEVIKGDKLLQRDTSEKAGIADTSEGMGQSVRHKEEI